MFKVISAEIKKILSKPSIYVVALILAAILVLGIFIYNPQTSTNNSITLNGDTFTAKLEDFNNTTTGYKKISLDKVNNAVLSINEYTINQNFQTYTRQEYINTLYANILDEFYAYRNYASYSTDLGEQFTQQKNKLKTSINLLNDEINNSLQLALYNSYSMISTERNYKDFQSTIKEIISWANVSPSKQTLATHCKEFENTLKPQLENIINSFIYPNLSNSIIADYSSTEENSKLSIIRERLQTIENEINLLATEIDAKGNEENIVQAPTMDKLANLYVNTANTYINLVKYELISNAFSYTKTSQQLDLLHLKDYSSYNVKSLLIKYKYLFDNNKIESDYSKPLTIGSTSNNDINAYDYAYFSIKLFSFVIIAYSVMLACNSIAGEIKEGSMRYFAIRPISRTEMYFGKLLSIILLSSILILFSGIIALLVGGAVYGYSSLNILTIFNSSFAVVVNPLIMFGIFLLSLILELSIYTSIALLLSALIKSDVLAVTIIIVIYLINIMLPLFVQGSNTWLSFYPFSHISLYTLFGSAVYATNDFFNLLLGAKVYATTNFALTLFIIVAVIAIINLVAVKIFKNKEL